MSYFPVQDGEVVHAGIAPNYPAPYCNRHLAEPVYVTEAVTCAACLEALAKMWAAMLEKAETYHTIFIFHTADGVINRFSQVTMSHSDDGRPFVMGHVEREDGKGYNVHYNLDRVISSLIRGNAWVTREP